MSSEMVTPDDEEIRCQSCLHDEYVGAVASVAAAMAMVDGRSVDGIINVSVLLIFVHDSCLLVLLAAPGATLFPRFVVYLLP